VSEEQQHALPWAIEQFCENGEELYKKKVIGNARIIYIKEYEIPSGA
jgi:hypothetical protein